MPLAIEILKQLKNQENIETHLIYSRAAEITLKEETDVSIEELCGLADVVYDNQNIGAAPASGSFRAKGMIVVPCSMKTVAGIESGYSDSLLLRAADVMMSFYNQPKNLGDCVTHLAGKVLDQFDIEGSNFKRWEGLSGD